MTDPSFKYKCLYLIFHWDFDSVMQIFVIVLTLCLNLSQFACAYFFC